MSHQSFCMSKDSDYNCASSKTIYLPNAQLLPQKDTMTFIYVPLAFGYSIYCKSIFMVLKNVGLIFIIFLSDQINVYSFET